MSIKSVLREELENSVRMKELFESELAGMPKGSVAGREINGRLYYYLVYRENGRVRTDYLGKSLSEEELSEYEKIKKRRAKCRGALSKLKKQIRYLRGALRGKEEV